MTSVHPPAGAVLQSTVAIVLVVVLVDGAELHAVVRRVELVAGIVAKVEAVESIPGVATKVVAVRQTVLVGLRSNSEHVVVGIPGETKATEGYYMLAFCNLRAVSFFFFKRKTVVIGVMFALLLRNLLLCVCVYLLFGAIPVNKLYPQDGRDGRGGSQLMYLLVAEPELCGVVW